MTLIFLDRLWRCVWPRITYMTKSWEANMTLVRSIVCQKRSRSGPKKHTSNLGPTPILLTYARTPKTLCYLRNTRWRMYMKPKWWSYIMNHINGAICQQLDTSVHPRPTQTAWSTTDIYGHFLKLSTLDLFT